MANLFKMCTGIPIEKRMTNQFIRDNRHLEHVIKKKLQIFYTSSFAIFSYSLSRNSLPLSGFPNDSIKDAFYYFIMHLVNGN